MAAFCRLFAGFRFWRTYGPSICASVSPRSVGQAVFGRMAAEADVAQQMIVRSRDQPGQREAVFNMRSPTAQEV